MEKEKKGHIVVDNDGYIRLTESGLTASFMSDCFCCCALSIF